MIGNVLRIALKDLRLLWRDKFGMFWVLAFPLIMGLFFGSVFGGGGSTAAMTVAVVDEDDTQASRDFAAALEETDAIRLWAPKNAEHAPIPVTEDLARDAVRKGSITAFVVLPKGYDSGGIFGGFGTTLRVGIDPSRKAEAGYLQGLLTEASFKRMQSMFSDRTVMKSEIDRVSAEVNDWDVPAAQKLVFKGFFGALETFMSDVDEDVYKNGPGAADGADAQDSGGGFSPVTIDMEEIAQAGQTPRTAFEISFPQAMMWAVIGTAAGFAVTFVRERKEGTLLRLRIAPHPMSVILAGKALGCFLACAGSLALLTAIAHFILGMRIENLGLYALGVVCTSICFVGVMMVMSVIGKTEEAVAGAGWGVMLMMAMLGGGMIPLMVMPPWMAKLSTISPVHWGIWSLEGAVWRGLTFSQMLPAYAVLLGVGVVAFGIGVVVLGRREV